MVLAACCFRRLRGGHAGFHEAGHSADDGQVGLAVEPPAGRGASSRGDAVAALPGAEAALGNAGGDGCGLYGVPHDTTVIVLQILRKMG